MYPSNQCDRTTQRNDFPFNVYLLIRVAVSFSLNREGLPVYSTFHLQFDLHEITNNILRGQSKINQKSVTSPFNKKQKSKVVCKELK